MNSLFIMMDSVGFSVGDRVGVGFSVGSCIGAEIAAGVSVVKIFVAVEIEPEQATRRSKVSKITKYLFMVFPHQ